jgi:hypothetical protein
MTVSSRLRERRSEGGEARALHGGPRGHAADMPHAAVLALLMAGAPAGLPGDPGLAGVGGPGGHSSRAINGEQSSAAPGPPGPADILREQS